MADTSSGKGRSRGRGARPGILLGKFVGLAAFLGGLGALTAIGALAPEPSDANEWAVLRETIRAVFWPCVFGGLMLSIACGLLLWLRHPRVLARMRWFRLKLGLLAVLIPLLHFGARGRMMALDAALEAGRLEELPRHLDRLTQAFGFALVAMLVVASIGRIKPRLGEPIGSRRGPSG